MSVMSTVRLLQPHWLKMLQQIQEVRPEFQFHDCRSGAGVVVGKLPCLRDKQRAYAVVDVIGVHLY